MNIHFVPSQKNFREQLEGAAEIGRTEWTCPKQAEIGEAVFFVILGEGVIATGKVASIPRQAPRSWGFPGRYCAKVADVEFLAAPVSLNLLAQRFPTWGYPTYPRSYTTVQSPLAEQIVGAIQMSERTLVDEPLSLPALFEGAPKKVSMIQFERNRRARERCLARWGTKCIACGLAFSEMYGPDFTGYIHVHHLEPLSVLRKSYRLNAEEDLRPLCPNCHAIAHRSNPPFSIRQIKQFMKEARVRRSGGVAGNS